MPNLEPSGTEAARLMRQMRATNEVVEPPGGKGSGATSIGRHILRAAPPGATGLELLAEQRAWNMAFSDDPVGVPQGRFMGQPPQLPRLVVVLVGVLGMAGAIWLLRQLSWLVAPAFLALNMVIVVYPVQGVMRRHGLPRAVAAAITVLVLLTMMAIFVLVGIWAVSQVVAVAPEYAGKAAELYQSTLDLLARMGIEGNAISSALSTINPVNVLGALTQVFSGVSGVAGMIGVVVSVVIMMMLDVPSWGRRMAVAGSTHPRTMAAMREFSGGVRRYWVVSTGFGALMATLNYVQLLVLGVPLPAVWALLTWTTTYIPSVGFFFSLFPPLLVALLAKGWQTALWLLAVYLLTTWIVQGVFQPKLTGNAIGVNATTAILSLLLWTWVFGPLGAIIALPCTQLVKALLVDADPKVRWANSLLSNEVMVRGVETQT